MIRDANRAADVIKRLRALFAKGDAAVDLVNLNEAIREVIALSSAELHSRRVVLRLVLADNLPPVSGDRIQLQQVLLNLLRNAVDSMSAMEDGPRQLLITTAKTELDVLVSVEDSGPGVDPADLERIFDAFYSTKPGGLGIGLSICRTIIESHRGRLWGTPAVSQGAIFQFTLPCADQAALGRAVNRSTISHATQ